VLSMSRGYKSRCRRRSGTPEQSPHINNDNMTEYLRYAFSARNKKPSTPPGRPQNSGDDPNDGDDGSPGDSPTGQAPRSLDMALKKLNENLICLECAKHIVEGVRCGHDQMTTRQKSCARCREKNCRCTLVSSLPRSFSVPFPNFLKADGETLELIKNLVDWHTRFTKGDKKYTVEELQNYQVRLNYRINQDITRAASETRRRSPVKSGQSTNKSGQSNFLSKLVSLSRVVVFLLSANSWCSPLQFLATRRSAASTSPPSRPRASPLRTRWRKTRRMRVMTMGGRSRALVWTRRPPQVIVVSGLRAKSPSRRS